MKGYRKLRKWAFEKLRHELPAYLTYHGLHHTLGVLRVTNRYIRRLKLKQHDAYILRIAALTHDIGFTESHLNHEAKGARMTAQKMKEYGFPESDIQCIKSLIMATKVPQNPKTFLEEILCDADLDYLGTRFYPEISHTLFLELSHLKILKSPEDWLGLTKTFLESHRYHTDYAKEYREPKKQEWLTKIKAQMLGT